MLCFSVKGNEMYPYPQRVFVKRQSIFIPSLKKLQRVSMQVRDGSINLKALRNTSFKDYGLNFEE